MALVFISHSGGDKPLADALFDLLQTGCDLRRDAVFCTSVEGAGIQTGADFVRWIEEKLGDAKLIVLIISPNFYASKFCLAEMGAAWSLKKDVFPLMTPDLARDPGVVFLGKQSAQFDATGLDDLRDRISAFHEETSRATARWTVKKEAFLRRLAEVLGQISQPQLVDRSQVEQEEKRTKAAMELLGEAEDKVRHLTAQVDRLEGVKDAEEVKAIKAEFAGTLGAFDEAKAAVKALLRGFSRVELRAIYATVAHDPWIPSQEVWDHWNSEMTKATKSGWIDELDMGYQKEAYVAAENHPRYAATFASVSDLTEAIGTLSSETVSELERDSQCRIDTTNWEFWEEQLLNNPLLH